VAAIIEGKIMNLSVEAKVAIAVATGFVALTMCVIAQGNREGATSGPNGYSTTNNSGLSFMSSQGLQGSEFGRTTADEVRTKFSDDTDETTITTNATSEER
jgi:hypothetical protein